MTEENHDNEHESFPESERESNKRKSLSQKTQKYVAQLLLNFKKAEGNKRLDELISDLEYFRRNYRQNLEQIQLEAKKNLASLYTTKLLIYNTLEKNLIEISCLSNKEVRKNRINSLYLWYKEKTQINEDLRKINMKSYKEIDEITEEDLKTWQQNKQEGEDENIEQEKKIDKKLEQHRNEEILDKKMINEYQRKILSKSLEERINKVQTSELNETNNDISIKDNAELAKTLMSLKNQEISANYSTFYSYKYGTNTASLAKFHQTENEFNTFRDTVKGGDLGSNFFPNYNKTTNIYFPPLNRETKFSYSYNRPQYNYENMIYENKILQNKLKFQAEKRSQEEIKSQIERIGKIRAKYKEEVNNKYEIKNVIDMYVKNNDFTSPLLKKYKLKPNKSMNDIHSRNIKRDNLYQKSSSKNQEYNVGITSIAQQQGSKTIRNINKEKQDIIPISPNNDIMNKIKIDSVKNIENKIVLEPLKLNKIKIKLKVQREIIQNNMLNKIKKIEKPPSEIITRLMSTDNLFQINKSYQSLCNIYRQVKPVEINNAQEKNENGNNDSKEDEDSFSHNFCLSLYDEGNLKKLNQNKHNKINFPQTIRKESKNKIEQLHNTYNIYKNNFLNLRRTVSDWKRGEYINLLDKMKRNITPKKDKDKKEEDIKKKILRKQNSLLNAIINPKDKSEFSQYFLPRTGTLLLQRVEEQKNKKKGK